MFNANDLSGWEKGVRNVCESLWWEDWNLEQPVFDGTLFGGDLNCTYFTISLCYLKNVPVKANAAPLIIKKGKKKSCTQVSKTRKLIHPLMIAVKWCTCVREIFEGCVWMRINVVVIVAKVLMDWFHEKETDGFVSELVWISILFCVCVCVWREACDSGVFPPVWNLGAVGLIPLFYISSVVLLPSLVALSLSYPFLLLIHSPCLFFPKGRPYCVALLFFGAIRRRVL